jgi:hypothetical protein
MLFSKGLGALSDQGIWGNSTKAERLVALV